MKQIIENFKNPNRNYAIYPIVHSSVSDKSLIETLDRRGFGGVVGNVQYTIDFPYNEDKWLATEEGVREYINRGMKVWIYDEKGYPSGTAGGYVTEEDPQYVAKGLYCYDYWRHIYGPCDYRADVPGDELWRAVIVPVNGGDPIDVTKCLNEKGVLYIKVPDGEYYLFMMSKRRLFDGTHATESYSEPRNYISLSDKEATQSFISCTHENYKKLLSDEFGKGIPAMFTDEPSLISWNIRTGVFPILPWLESYPEDFEKKYNYDFMLACVAVAFNMGENVIKRKCDFWDFIADSVADGYFGTIQEWCHKNNLKSSGHMMEEERLQAHVFAYGSFFRSMKKMDWPGIDQLNTRPQALMNTNIVPIARFVASFADINGEHEVFTEFSDHYERERGEIVGIDCYYHSLNWHLAMGVNNFTSYYRWSGLSDEEIQELNRYTARSGYLLRQGKRESTVAVYYPEASMWANYTPSVKLRGVDDSECILDIETTFNSVSWSLLKNQVDFDYIDCDILISSEIKNGELCYRDRTYKAIVLPCVSVIEDDALKKLIELADADIKVIFCGKKPEFSRATGKVLELSDEINEKISEDKMKFLSLEEFVKSFDETMPEKCRGIQLTGNSEMLLSHSRKTSDGKYIVFVTNMDESEYHGKMTVNGDYKNVYILNPANGDISDREDFCGIMDIDLASAMGKFLVFE